MKINKIDVIKVIDDVIAKSINIDSITILEKVRDKVRLIDVYPIDIGKLYNHTRHLTGLVKHDDIFEYIINDLIKNGSLDKSDYIGIGQLYNNFHNFVSLLP